MLKICAFLAGFNIFFESTVYTIIKQTHTLTYTILPRCRGNGIGIGEPFGKHLFAFFLKMR